MELSPPSPLLVFFSQIHSWMCTKLCSAIWPTLARGFSPCWEAPCTTARWYSRRGQGKWRQQKAGSVKPGLQLALCSARGSPLHLGCKLRCLWDLVTLSCSSQLPGKPWPFFQGAHPQELRNYRARFIHPCSGTKQHVLQPFLFFCPLRICIKSSHSVSHVKLHHSICY